MSNLMRYYNVFRRFCAFLLGAVFLLSGILKLMDPVGTSFIVKSYFALLHIGFLDGAAEFFGVSLAFTESLVGAALMSGVWRKATGIAVCALTGVFTVITLFLLIFNPPMDCGCFGEALHLTHSQTFIKNLVLCALCCFAFIPMKELDKPVKVKYVSFALAACSLVALGVYSMIGLPLKDYTAYKTDTLLQGAEDAEAGEFAEPEFIYEKDGVQKAFSLEDLPDSSWTFVDSRIASGGFNSGAVLSLTDAEGKYCSTVPLLGEVLVVSAYKPLSEGRYEKIKSLLEDASREGFKPLLLIPSDDFLPGGVSEGCDPAPAMDSNLVNPGTQSSDSSLAAQSQFSLKAITYYSDYKTLATLNRSNGGVTYLNDGRIVQKWSYSLRPSAEDLARAKAEDPQSLALERQSRGSLSLQAFLLYIFAVLLLL